MEKKKPQLTYIAFLIRKNLYCTLYQEIQKSVSASYSSSVINFILISLTYTQVLILVHNVPCHYRVKMYQSIFKTKRKKNWLLKEYKTFYHIVSTSLLVDKSHSYGKMTVRSPWQHTFQCSF